MPRHAREKCESGIYHIMIRGINRYDIFHDEEDYQRFLETILKIKGSDNFDVYAYCLMSNHVHLMLHEKKDEISKTMKQIGISYAWWYNWKYGRVGHLFQDRFKSESIKDDSHLLSVVRYIHSNPVKAGLVKEAEGYNRSSCRTYYGAKEYPIGLTDKNFILGLLSSNKTSAINILKKFTKEDNHDKFLDYEIKTRKSDEELRAEISGILDGESIAVLQTMDKCKRNETLSKVKEIQGATQRQIARVTGINQSTISQI
jgi:putative transposase